MAVAGAERDVAPGDRHLLVTLAAGLAVLCAAHAATHLDTHIDDAFISYRYAQSLAEGHGLVFNLGERVEGFSNPLWVLLAALMLRLGVEDIHAVMQLFGIAFACGAVVMVFAAALKAVPHPFARAWAAVPALVLAGSPILAFYACTGMETALYVCLLAGGVAALCWRGVGPAFGLMLGLAALTRPEAPYLFVVMLAMFTAPALLRRQHVAARGLLGAGLAFALPFGAWLVFRVAYFGELLPNTYFAKSAPLAPSFASGLDYLEAYATGRLGIPFAAAALLLVRGDRLQRTLCVLWLLSFLPVLWTGADMLHLFRFFGHVQALEALVVGCAVLRLGALVAGGAPRMAAALAVVTTSVVVGLDLQDSRAVASSESQIRPVVAEQANRIGAWIADTPEIHRVALVDIGIIGYRSRKALVDLAGLTDATIARAPGIPLDRAYDPAYVLDKKPELVIFQARIPDDARSLAPEAQLRLFAPTLFGVERRLYQAPRFHEQYVFWVDTTLVPIYRDGRYPFREAGPIRYFLFRRRDVDLAEGSLKPVY